MLIRKDKKLCSFQSVASAIGKSGRSMHSRRVYKNLFKNKIVESFGLYLK